MPLGRQPPPLERRDRRVKTLDALSAVIAFFEERRGRLHGFRFRDRADCKSCAPSATPAATDQPIGTGDGTTRTFALVKRYGAAFAPYDRRIEKPVTGSVSVAVNGAALGPSAFTVDTSAGTVTLTSAPAAGAAVTAGYLFDVPVRFDTDHLAIDLSAFAAGEVPAIPLVEIRP